MSQHATFSCLLTTGFQDRICCFKRDCKTLFLVSQLGNKTSLIASMLISQVQLINIRTSSDLLSVKEFGLEGCSDVIAIPQMCSGM